jgi:hypothetical protein
LSGGNLYIFGLPNIGAEYPEDLLKQHAITYITPIVFNPDFVNFTDFTLNITSFTQLLNNVDIILEHNSDFVIHLVAIDNLNNVTVDVNGYLVETPGSSFKTNTVEATRTTSLDIKLDMDSHLENPVEVYAVAYTDTTTNPENYELIETVAPGLSNHTIDFTLNKLYYYDDSNSTTTTMTDTGANNIFVYTYAINKTTGERVFGETSILPLDSNPHAYVESFYEPFTNSLIVDSSIFSKYNNIIGVYVGVFSDTVDIETDPVAVNTFIKDNTPNLLTLSGTNIPKFIVQTYNNAYTQAYTDLNLHGSTETIVEANGYKVLVLVEDAFGNLGTGVPAKNGFKISVRNVDWSQEVANTPDYDLSSAIMGIANTFGNYGHSCSISADGGTALVAGYKDTDGGGAWIWTKDDSTATGWSDTAVDLSKISGAKGYYGFSCSISADGGTALIAGYNNGGDGGCAWIWTKDDSTATGWSDTAVDLSKISGAKGYYGQSCSISADGGTALIAGYSNTGDGGGAWIWTKDDSTATGWSDTAVDLSKISGAKGYYGQSCSISADGGTALVAGTNDINSGCAWIWQGIDNGEKELLNIAGGSGNSITSYSTLRTLISSTTVESPLGIKLTGSVTADKLVDTTYYAVATTTQLTSEEVRTMINTNNTASDSLYSAFVTATVPLNTTTTLTDLVVPNIVDTSSLSPGSYTVKPSSGVHNAFVYLFATDGFTTSHDDIETQSILTLDNVLPYTTVKSVAFSPFDETLKVVATAFTTNTANITEVYIGVFIDSIDMLDSRVIDIVKASANLITSGTSLNQFEVGLFEPSYTQAYSDLANSATTVAIVAGTQYKAIIVTIDNDTPPNEVSVYDSSSVTTGLRSTIATATTNSTGIAYTGSVQADATNATDYFTIATTDPTLTNLDIVNMIQDPAFSNALNPVYGAIPGSTNVTNDILLKVVDVNSSIYSATAVNKAYVYTYGTDNTIDANRDIDKIAYDMEGFSNNPIFPTVQSVEYIPFDNTFNITASYFSTESNITKVYDCLALTSNADITKGSISNLIASNALPFTGGLDFPVYSVNSRSNLATGAYNALGESVQIVTEDFDKYQFVAVAEDGVGEMGVGYQVGGGLSVQSTSILRTILDTVTFDPTGIAFTGSVIADENNTTNYYTLATTDPNLSRLQVVDLIENYTTSLASVGSNISANSNVVTDSILTQVVDVNSSVYSATAVNKAYVYTYAIDESGSNNHRDIDMKTVDGTIRIITRISDQNSANTSATRTTSPTFVGGETMALSYTLANGDIVYMSSDGSDDRDGAHLFDGNTTGDWTNASHGAGGVPMTWAYKFTGSKKYVNQMKFWQAPNTHPAGNITISYYDESTTTWKNVTSPDKTGFNNSVAPVYAESITINFDGFISDYWKIIVDKHPSSPYPNLVGLYEWEIYGSDNITGVLVPYVKYDTIVQPTSPESGLTISDATVFSSVANIDKYYAFNLVTGVPVTPGTDSFVNPTTLTDEDIITFTQTYLENQANISSVGWSSYPATGGGGELSVYSGSNIQQYAVEQVPNMTFTHAFNTLTPTDSSSLSSITNVAEWAFSSYMVAVDTAMRYGLRADNGYDPLADVASLSFRTSAAIADLAEGTYTSSDTLTYNETTITSGSGVGSFPAGGYIIGTDVNGWKYMSPQVGKSFGTFDLGMTSFTLAFVVSNRGINSDRLTYGINPDNRLNVHFAHTHIGFQPLDFTVSGMSSSSGLASSQFPNYSNADYCLFLISFNQSTRKVTTILRTDTNHSYQITVTDKGGTFYNSGSSRRFKLVNESSNTGPTRVYDMLIFPGEYMTEDRATYPIFGMIEDFVKIKYGVVIP